VSQQTTLSQQTAPSWMPPERAVLLSRLLNVAALFALLGVLAGSLQLQFGVGEQPCPLCIVQRSGMFAIAVGPMMNLLWGIRARHYALSILGAVVGAAGSTRQILLHIADPNDPGYGPAVLGWHLYTWALVTFIIAIVGCALLILWQTPYEAHDEGILREPGPLRPVALFAFVWFGLVAIIWVVIDLAAVGLSVIPECGLGECPDDPPAISGLGNMGGWWAVLAAGVIAAVIAWFVARRVQAKERAQA